jgi:calcineurin-like phosphoesterase
MNGLPTRFEVGTGPVVLNALLVDIETASGRARSVERIARIIEA